MPFMSIPGMDWARPGVAIAQMATQVRDAIRIMPSLPSAAR